jgi:hypothetical protein
MPSSHSQRFLSAPRSRRDLLQNIACGFGSIAMTHLASSPHAKSEDLQVLPKDHVQVLSPKPTHFDPKAMNVIFLYMDGGVSQVDSFDPKPELDKWNGKPFPQKTEPTQFNNIGNTLASPWKFQQYGESGIPVSDLFPHTAKHVDELAIIRSMTSGFRSTRMRIISCIRVPAAGTSFIGCLVRLWAGNRVPGSAALCGTQRRTDSSREDSTTLAAAFFPQVIKHPYFGLTIHQWLRYHPP